MTYDVRAASVITLLNGDQAVILQYVKTAAHEDHSKKVKLILLTLKTSGKSVCWICSWLKCTDNTLKTCIIRTFQPRYTPPRSGTVASTRTTQPFSKSVSIINMP